jgi:hypothetical protein
VPLQQQLCESAPSLDVQATVFVTVSYSVLVSVCVVEGLVLSFGALFLHVPLQHV